MSHSIPAFVYEQMNAKIALACDSVDFTFTSDVDALSAINLAEHLEFLNELRIKVATQQGWHMQGTSLSTPAREYHERRLSEYNGAMHALNARADLVSIKLVIKLAQLTPAPYTIGYTKP